MRGGAQSGFLDSFPFDPAGLNSDTNQTKELKNGRLAVRSSPHFLPWHCILASLLSGVQACVIWCWAAIDLPARLRASTALDISHLPEKEWAGLAYVILRNTSLLGQNVAA